MTKMMPRPGQSMDAYLHECAVAAGEFLPRATEEQIEELKAKGYMLNEFEESASEHGPAIPMWAWVHRPSDDFQDDEPSYTEADAWAGALAHSQR